MPQSANTLRIKRSDIRANATESKPLTGVAAKADATAANAVAVAVVKKPKEQPELTKPTAAAAAAAVGVGTAAKVNDHAATVAAVVTPAPAAHDAAVDAPPTVSGVSDKKLEELLPLELAADRMHRSKRRMSIVDESLFGRSQPNRHGRRHSLMGANPMAPPYVYYNKMVSPDGKQELKEFQLLAPNMVIESMQHDLNCGPIPLPDVGGVVLINADSAGLNGHLHGLGKQKHHGHKHKSSAAMALPPFLYMLQQMLQPNLNIDLEPQPLHSRTADVPFFQLLDSAVDTALRNNPGVLDHLLNDNELGEKEKDKDHDGDINELQLSKLEKEKSKESNDLLTNHKDDELLVSCPIHHDRHANNNGEIIDDDVVLVNECHIV